MTGANRIAQRVFAIDFSDFKFFFLFWSQEGSIGHQLVIRPVPLDVSAAEDGSVHHVVFKRSNDHEMDERLSDFAYMEPDRMQKRYRRSTDDEIFEERTRSKREIPHIIYPEILVIVDYDGYRLHGGDNVQVNATIIKSWKCSVNTCFVCFQIKRYFVSFWNGVDLRYRLLKGPKIRISIAGIIISRVSTLFSNSEWTAYAHTCDGIKRDTQWPATKSLSAWQHFAIMRR